MPLPVDTAIFGDKVDPTDVIDWLLKLSGELLRPGEQVASYTLSPTAEFVALGGEIMSGGGRDMTLIEGNTQLLFWTQIAAGYQQDAAFAGEGVTLGLVLTVVTNNNPARTRQRTFAIKVAQR